MKNKKFMLVTTIVTLLPILAGVLLWDQLPDKLPTHFGLSGTADGWSGKPFAVFGIPLIMLAFQWICYAATLLDKHNQGHNRRVLDLIGLIFPGMSLIFGVVIYSKALGMEMNMGTLMLPLMGLMFILLGNWLPKIKQNTTLGIKLPWTIYNEENWNKTHRVGGFAWVIGGLVFCIMGFVPGKVLAWLMPANLILMLGVPVFYSWNLARKQKAAGSYQESQVSKNLNQHPALKIISAVLVVGILIFAGVILFTGDISYTCTDTALVIEADFWDDLTVSYAEIDSVEYRDSVPDGEREWGFGSIKLAMGFFSSEELGDHTRYRYEGTESCILLRAGDGLLVLSAENEEATQELYDLLTEKLMG